MNGKRNTFTQILQPAIGIAAASTFFVSAECWRGRSPTCYEWLETPMRGG